MMFDKLQPLYAAPGTGRWFYVLTDWATIRVRGEDTGGAFSIVEQITMPYARPPLHTHQFDEVHYILDGEYEYVQADRPAFRAQAGAVIYTPRNTVHTYQNIGATNGRLIAFFRPAGFEHFFEAAGVPGTDTSTPAYQASPRDLARMLEIVETRYATTIVEPIAELAQLWDEDGNGGSLP